MDNALWALFGFVAGLFGALWLERHNRFRSALDQAARTIDGFGEAVARTESVDDLHQLTIGVFKAEQFELALQGQSRAREELGIFRTELESIVKIANTDLLKPEAANFLKQMKTDYFHATKVRTCERLVEKQGALIDRVLTIESDWIVITLGRRMGPRVREHFQNIIEYLESTGELKR